MKLRKLEPKDAPLMLEWMHDADAVIHLQGNFQKKTLADCLEFIQKDWPHDLHLAIVDDSDTYMGTVSLKHLDPERKDAEFAIAIRRCAMGTGIARQAMEAVLNRGLTELGLQRIFWCVSPNNIRAVRFYEKNGWDRADPSDLQVQRYYSPEQTQGLLWYCVER